jgi:hypothetical protein
MSAPKHVEVISRQHLLLLSVTMATGGMLATGCDASVDQFAPSARYICAGQTVHLSWKVTGTATMTSTPPVAGLPDGPVSAQGEAAIAPQVTTSVQLHVTRFLGNPTSSVQQIDVLQSPQTPEPLTVSLADPSAGCGNGKVWATVHAKAFSNSVKVATVGVRPNDQRTYQISHGGIDGTVAPGATSTPWAGSPIVGDWVLTSPLLSGESCGPTLPANLGVDVFTQCVIPGGGT